MVVGELVHPHPLAVAVRAYEGVLLKQIHRTAEFIDSAFGLLEFEDSFPEVA